MRNTLLGLIAAAAIVTAMAPAAMAQNDEIRPEQVRHHHRHAQATETTRNAYGSYYEDRGVAVPSWSSDVHAGNHTEQFDDPRVSVNGN